MIGFEVDTLMTSSAMARVGVAALFTAIGLKLARSRHFLLWGGSLWLAFLAFMLEALSFSNEVADLATDLLSHLAMGGSLLVLAAGLLAFEGKPLPRWAFAVALLPAVSHATAHLLGLERTETMPLLLSALAVVLSFSLVQVLRAMRSQFMYAYVLLFATLALQIAVWLVPVFLSLFGARRQYAELTLLMDVAIFAVLNISLFALDAERSRKELERLATTDTLTGLSNRRGVLDTLTGGTTSGAILIADIDRFKRINDLWGHAAGDLVLQEFSRRLKGVFRRATDVTGRWGGEEFIVVALGLPLDVAVERAEILRKAIADQPIDIGTQQIAVTVSIGVTEMVDGTAATIPLMVERADVALYEAKEEGRNRVKLAA